MAILTNSDRPVRAQHFLMDQFTRPQSLLRPPRPLVLAGLVVAGIALGAAWTWSQLRLHSGFGVAAGPWQVNLLAGSPDADALTRTRVAIGGLLALNRDETMYFVASRDSEGQPLRARCRYRILGTPPQALWWSVTAYAQDLYLFADTQRRYSVNSATARLDAQGRFQVQTGPQPPAADTAGLTAGHTAWLPTPGTGDLVLTLRVYHPTPALQADPGQLDAPRILSEAPCR